MPNNLPEKWVVQLLDVRDERFVHVLDYIASVDTWARDWKGVYKGYSHYYFGLKGVMKVGTSTPPSSDVAVLTLDEFLSAIGHESSKQQGEISDYALFLNKLDASKS